MPDNTTTIIMIAVLVCGFCLIQVVMLGILFMVFQNRRKGENAWKIFAAKYGFTHQSPGILDRGYGSMSGQFEGQHVTIESYSTGGRHSLRWTVVYVPIKNPRGLVLSVGAKGIDGTIFKALGAQDIAIGMKEFDDKFTIQSNPPELASKILIANTDLRAEINAVSPYELQYKDKGASCRVLGFQTTEAVLLDLLHLTRRFADIIENSG